MTKFAEQVPTGIGPAFSSELGGVGLSGLAISWSSKGSNDTVWYHDEYTPNVPNGLTSGQITTLLATIAVHDSSTPAPPDDEDIMRTFIISYAEFLKPLTTAQRRQEVDTTDYENFLDYIIELGPEGF